MTKKTNIQIIFLIFFFVILSFVPTLYEYANRNKISPERYFVLEHNYNFDYNFYLSRIRQGIEGKWLVTEKYYNLPHKDSLFQVVYLYLGKIGMFLGLSAPAIYHTSRFIFGFLLLWAIFKYGSEYFSGKHLILFFLLAATAGSFPVLVKAGEFYRFATYMGWWSVIDSLQRITIMPHILIGQIFLLILIARFLDISILTYRRAMIWGIFALFGGIIFPPTVIIIYVYLFILVIFEFLDLLALRVSFGEKKKRIVKFFIGKISKIFVFIVFSIPCLVYLQIGLKEQPWKALALFDIEHRFIMPYWDYSRALGPILILGFIGLIWVLLKGNRKYKSPVAWISAILVLFFIFENVPEQSPLRFTEGLIHIPLAVLATYFLTDVLKNNILRKIISGGVIMTGLSVMLSMILWLTDQAFAKRSATWKVPLGAQLAYPMRDFMDGIFYLRDKTNHDDVVLGYITAGNFIPAYAGNYVYIGHANTPDEDEKEVIAAQFFKGEMKIDEAKNWFLRERISYVFFGPQEKELGNIDDLKGKYNFLKPVYSNNEVFIYQII